VPSVFHRELLKNYGVVPQFPTGSPTEWGNYRRSSAVNISQRVVKKLRSCATFFNGNYQWNGELTDGTTNGLVPLVFHRELSNNYEVVPHFLMKITDEHHTSRSARLLEALLPMKLPVAQFPTIIFVRITDGSKTKGGIFEIFGARFNLFSLELPT